MAGIIALRPLARFWAADPDYAFGWGVPLLAAYLFSERWRRRPVPHSPLRDSSYLPVLALIAWGAAFLLSRLIAEVVPDWRPNLWLGTSLYVAGIVTWSWMRGGRDWVIHFLFACSFILCSVPWPYNFESPITQGLMRWNAALVADTLVVADIPARAAGSTLILSTGQLGIEEACSGVRSLQAALMTGLFLGAFHHFPRRERGLLLLFAAVLALTGNYFRLLMLAWRGAHSGIASVAAIHDSAGGAILVFTIFGLWLACFLMREAARDSATELVVEPAAARGSSSDNTLATRWAAGLLLAIVFCEVSTQAWFAWRETGAVKSPAWSARWTKSSANYQSIPISAATHQLLGDDTSEAGSWSDAQGWCWRAMWFTYPPQAINRIASDVHNPEVCLRAAGFGEKKNFGWFSLPGQNALPPVHAYLFSSSTQSDYVFWISSAEPPTELNSSSSRGEIIYGRTVSAFLGRLLLWGEEAWRGERGAAAQTLEVSISGAPNYAEARRAFLVFARGAIAPPPPRDGAAGSR